MQNIVILAVIPDRIDLGLSQNSAFLAKATSLSHLRNRRPGGSSQPHPPALSR